jgi:type III restriction enzyme
LYNIRDSKGDRPGKTTMSEAQLIGRGARYCPFIISTDQELYKRKYDFDVENELKLCEELYFHSAQNPRYIVELNKALEEIGIKAKNVIEREVKIKESFKKTEFYKSALIYLNKQVEYDNAEIFSIDDSSIPNEFNYHLRTGATQTTTIYEDPSKQNIKLITKTFSLLDFGAPIVRKAIDKIEFYRFNNLKNYFPNLQSINEFITSNKYLGKVNNINVEGLSNQLSNINPVEKLRICIKVLYEISESISTKQVYYKGTKQFEHYLLKDKIKEEKTLNFVKDESSDKEFGKSMNNQLETNIYMDLSNKNWFIFNDNFGTSEEKYFIKYIDIIYERLKKKYDEIYLVRNERFFRIYNFDDGRPFEPDFVLYLINKKEKTSLYYQIFIEPKGGQFADMNGKFDYSKESWKQEFLKMLKNNHKIFQLWKDREYIIWGMPFYNETLTKIDFEDEFNKLL